MCSQSSEKVSVLMHTRAGEAAGGLGTCCQPRDRTWFPRICPQPASGRQSSYQ